MNEIQEFAKSIFIDEKKSRLHTELIPIVFIALALGIIRLIFFKVFKRL